MFSSPSLPRVIYRFDRFELFPDVEEMRKDGALVPLAPQPFRLLLFLVERAGVLVTREEIQDALWGVGTFVSFEQGINAVIRRIRFALHEDAEVPRFLQTLPRRGYCFIAPVERIEVMPLTAATPLDLPKQVPPSVSPLPVSPLHERRFGLARAWAIVAITLLVTHGPLGTHPAANPGEVLRVSISPVVRDGSSTDLDPGEIADELRSRLGQVLPGRIRVAGVDDPADLRIVAALWKDLDSSGVNASMIETSSGRRVWSETFRRSGETSDFTVEVAIRVSRAVVDRYVPSVRRNRSLRAGISPAAVARYREAREILARPLAERYCDRALELLDEAVRLEPRFAEAWSAIGEIWTERAMAKTGESQRSAIRAAHSALDRALAADPQFAEALNNRGLVLMVFARSFHEAETLIRKAIAADPSFVDPHINLAALLAATGRHDEAVAEMRRAQSIDPASTIHSPIMACIYLMGRRYGDAYAEYRAALTARRPRESVRWEMMSSAIAAARWDDAARSLSSILGDVVEIPRDVPDRGVEFRKHLRRLESAVAAKEPAGVDPYTLAWLHAQTGNADLAFAALERAAQVPSQRAIFAFVDPRLDPIRSDPRFAGHLARFGRAVTDEGAPETVEPTKATGLAGSL